MALPATVPMLNKLYNMSDDVQTFDDFFNHETIEWCLWYYHQFDNHRFNKIKYIQDTHWALPFNRRFCNYVKQRVSEFITDATIHSIYIGNDVHPGGVHTDGWLYPEEKNLSYKTILVPLKINVPVATIIFNERASQGLTLNNVTGLNSHGIDTMTQSDVINKDQPFDTTVHKDYLQHLNIDGLRGLTMHSVHHWVPGRAMSWDRSRWHGPVFFQSNNLDRYHVVIMTHKHET